MGNMKYFTAALIVLCLAISGCGSEPGSPESARSPEAEFANPPAEARMATYWWVFGPAWTRDEIRRELQVLKSGGIGRVMIFPLYPYEVDNPERGIRNLEYLSDEFLETFQYAVATARELGMEVDLVMGTGWPYGGPMVPQELSPRRIYSHTLAVNATAGSAVTQSLPPLEEYDDLIAVQLVPKSPVAAETQAAIDVTDRVTPQNEVSFEAPAGEWSLMVFVQGLTKQRHEVVFAAAGAGGNAIDHLDPKAVDLYLEKVSSKLAGAVSPGQIRAMYSASFEVADTSWTPGFLEEFERRRGYSLRPHLAALFRDEGEKSLHIRHDYWRTIAEMAADNYCKRVGDWCRQRGFGFQAESYGVPSVTLASFSGIDYPMGEDYNWKEFNRVRWASSAARFYQQPVVSVEAYTWLRMARYTASLEDIKLATDLHFLSGANRMVAHGYAYSPPEAGSPGWGYYAGLMLTENQPWWPYFHHLAEYVHRAGYILSLGKPVADVLLYLPAGDLSAEFAPGNFNLAKEVLFRLDRPRTMDDYGWGLDRHLGQQADIIETIVTSGYSLDGVDYSILADADVSVTEGRLRIGHGSYDTLILPGLRGLPVEDLERIGEFCRSGGTVISTLRVPEFAYGFQNRERNANRFKELIRELYGGVDTTQSYTEKTIGAGKAIFVQDETANLLRALQSRTSDIQVNPSDKEIGFVHRRTANQDFYFLANTGGQSKRTMIAFRAGHRRPRLWDPMTGKIREVSQYRFEGERTWVDVELEPHGSMIVEFGASTEPAPAPQQETAQPPVERELIVAGPWRLSWPDQDMTPQPLPSLRSWTAVDEAKFFSGTGRYQTTFQVPDDFLSGAATFLLDLGEVRETANVTVNGKPVGVAWKSPYRLALSGYLQSGDNSLQIDVSNLLINHVLNQPVKDYSDVQQRYRIGIRIRRPDEKEKVQQPVPSGLLGPVRVIRREGVQ